MRPPARIFITRVPKLFSQHDLTASVRSNVEGRVTIETTVKQVEAMIDDRLARWRANFTQIADV